ncbi:ABC transporter substrate-binding protein [Treponema sp.]
MKRIMLMAVLMVFALGTTVFGSPAQELSKSQTGIGNTIVVYATLDDPQQKTVEKIWYKYYPDCRIEWITDSVGKLIARARGEINNPQADVIMGGLFESDGTTFHDVLQPYTPTNAAELTKLDPYGYYSFFDEQYMAFVVNKDLAKKLGVEIKGYKDLLQPALKGKIIQADPSASSSAYRQFHTMLALMGDKFGDEKSWNYIDKLIANSNGVITTSSSTVFKSVISGEYVVGLSYENIIQMQIEKNNATNISLVYPIEGNTACASGAGMVKGAKHKAAAAAFLDFCSSAEYQTARSIENCARGVNKGISYANYPADEKLGLVKIDWEWLGTQKNALLEKWKEHWAEYSK